MQTIIIINTYQTNMFKQNSVENEKLYIKF